MVLLQDSPKEALWAVTDENEIVIVVRKRKNTGCPLIFSN